MAFYFLNKLDKSISKKDLELEFKKFGKLKFIGDIRQEKNSDFNSTIAVFNEPPNKSAIEEYCKSKKIILKEKLENSQQQTSNIRHNDKKRILDDKRIESSTISNPSFYFYKDKAYGIDIENFQLENNYEEMFKINGAKTFELTTTYPGLFVGSGYSHPKLKKDENDKKDFMLGFFFDHTTGLPIISGSSIKGMLRSVFKHQEFMNVMYDKKLTEDIFEDHNTVFYDAFIVGTKNKHKNIFGNDYITSHHSDKTNGAFLEPDPVKFLKILPDVTFRFQFKCDAVYLQPFKDIILDFGLGAKTNVGYGQFREK